MIEIWFDSSPGKIVGRCHCGRLKVFWRANVVTGRTKSCGCDRRKEIGAKNTYHGKSTSRIYRIHRAMMNRCYLETDAAYADYGGRGITVCERWWAFRNFYEDVGDRPAGMSLDRIDNDKGYSPENCRWAPKTVQMNNTRLVKRYPWRGRQATLREIEQDCGIPRERLKDRLRKGWSLERATTTSLSLRRCCNKLICM